jgi:biopolymer transport protein ExbD
MGAQITESGAGDSSGSLAEGEELLSSINVTPFVDVVLVLLVIFMIATPQLVKDTIGLKLPKTQSGDGPVSQSLGVVITEQGQILLNGQLTSPETLTESVKTAITQNPEITAIISADTEARHGDVVRAIDLVKSAGLSRFAVQIQRENP